MRAGPVRAADENMDGTGFEFRNIRREGDALGAGLKAVGALGKDAKKLDGGASFSNFCKKSVRLQPGLPSTASN